MLAKCIVFLAIVSAVFAAVAIAPLEPKPTKFEREPGCYIADLKKVLPFGQEESSPSKCQKYSCSESHVQIFTCGVAAAKGTCKVVEDKTKIYPDCCPKIIC